MKVEDVLVSTGAIGVTLDQPITFASGIVSPIYCDNRKLLSHVAERDVVLAGFVDIISTSFADATIVAGIATGGIPWGAMVADKLELPFVYVRPKPKEHGKGKQIEGEIPSNANAVVVEDLVTTGGSSLSAINALKSAHVDIMGLVAIFSYEFPSGNKLHEANIEYKSLTTFEDVVQALVRKGSITAEELQKLSDWHSNPEDWQ